jgi:hypothetical protein
LAAQRRRGDEEWGGCYCSSGLQKFAAAHGVILSVLKDKVQVSGQFNHKGLGNHILLLSEDESARAGAPIGYLLVVQ